VLDRIRLDADARSVGRARRFCASMLGDWGAPPDLVDTCLLLVSELATNAVLHARTPFTVSISRNRDLRVEVVDADPTLPQVRDYSVDAASGRGLHLISSMAADFGARAVEGGKAVWFVLPWRGPS